MARYTTPSRTVLLREIGTRRAGFITTAVVAASIAGTVALPVAMAATTPATPSTSNPPASRTHGSRTPTLRSPTAMLPDRSSRGGPTAGRRQPLVAPGTSVHHHARSSGS